MKILHAADLHLGKRLYELSLKADQEHMLRQLLAYVAEEKPDVLLLCGDIYDKAMPAAESVNLLDDFLTALSEYNVTVLMIAGNHDSPSRLAYGARLLAKQRIHIAGTLQDGPLKLTLCDEYGPVHFVLLPFFRLYEARLLLPEHEEDIKTYEDALRLIFAELGLPAGERKVLLAHQHFSDGGSELLSESEINIVGGLEACPSAVLEDFDYAALGHLHRPQKLSQSYIRYAGSPLAYSFSELAQAKSFPLLELKEAGTEAAVRLLPIEPLRPMAEKRGLLQDLLAEADTLTERERTAYLRVVLTDRERLEHPLRRLQSKYPNVLQLTVERDEEVAERAFSWDERPENKDLIRLFADFYSEQTGAALTEEETSWLREVWDELREEQEERGQA